MYSFQANHVFFVSYFFLQISFIKVVTWGEQHYLCLEMYTFHICILIFLIIANLDWVKGRSQSILVVEYGNMVYVIFTPISHFQAVHSVFFLPQYILDTSVCHGSKY